MDESVNFNLPYIMVAQAQKHVTHNKAIQALDTLVQISVLNKDLTVPPTSPTDGERYIPASGATGTRAGPLTSSVVDGFVLPMKQAAR